MDNNKIKFEVKHLLVILFFSALILGQLTVLAEPVIF
jgi:hypothetical protein